MNLDSNDSTYDNIRQGTDIYIHNVPPRYRLSKFSAQIIRFHLIFRISERGVQEQGVA